MTFLQDKKTSRKEPLNKTMEGSSVFSFNTDMPVIYSSFSAKQFALNLSLYPIQFLVGFDHSQCALFPLIFSGHL